MLSEETRRRINRLAATQQHYRPSLKLRQQLAPKTLVMLVGATCMGKSTLLQAIEAAGCEIAIVGTTTTRPPREGDDEARYTYYAHTDTGLAPLLNSIEAGEVIQYAVNPHSGFIYASRLEDYPGQRNIGDYFAAAVEDFHDYGFGTVLVLSVVTSPDLWLERFETRFPAGHPERNARLSEAIDSLRWSLSQPVMHWICNITTPETAAREVIRTLAGKPIPPSPQAPHYAEACLALAENMTS